MSSDCVCVCVCLCARTCVRLNMVTFIFIKISAESKGNLYRILKKSKFTGRLNGLC